MTLGQHGGQSLTGKWPRWEASELSKRVSRNSLAGAVTSLAPSPSFLASVARDRYVRIHSTFSPPQETGHQQERKGEVLEKLFMKSTPTVIAWDQSEDQVVASPHDAGDEDVWEAMEAVGGDSEDDSGSKKSADLSA
ncbi:hypothetical protein H0H81_001155 [Sphagnurus paluster]|uniref:Uncharacterized protein n=1 Tax=Sphagnurus paluster TaxID=117069 RepID=A0A9P7GR57_9AGAR|nr:hypothetical protein H0H81_001155 [Sphagnurus paluster]